MLKSQCFVAQCSGILLTMLRLVCLAVVLCLVLLCLRMGLFTRHRFEWITNDGQCWAVVTGAGSGMGFEFARQLALKGYHLMLLDKCDLDEAKERILMEVNQVTNQVAKKNIEVRILSVDFTRLDIYEQVEQFLNVQQNDIFVLVNNVGIALSIPDYFLGDGKDFSRLNQNMINVNVIATTRMTELVLPSMVHKHRGLILNMSSWVARKVYPMLTTYAATKAYVSKLSECLAAEYEAQGVTFVSFHPIVVSTAMSHHLPPNLVCPSSRAFVHSALSQIKYRYSLHSNGYWVHSLLDRCCSLIACLFSQKVLARMMHWLFVKSRQELLKRNEPATVESAAPDHLQVTEVV